MSEFHVQRSIEIAASPQKVFEAVSDYGTWTAWSPWLGAEPDAEVTVSDDSASVGSVYAWRGEIVGQGEIEHRLLEPGVRIEDEIRFFRPFKSVSKVAFDFAPAGDGTRVTWHMNGSLPWFLFWMRSQMEAFIAMDYQRGLKMLKEWIETGQVLSTTHVQGVRMVGPLKMVGQRATSSFEEIGPVMQAAFDRTHKVLANNDIPTDGEAMAVYHKFDMKAQITEFTCGLVVDAAPPTGLTEWEIPSTRAYCVEHVGKYDHLGNAWSVAQQHVRCKKLKPSRIDPFEIYKTAPGSAPEAETRTEIFIPLK